MDFATSAGRSTSDYDITQTEEDQLACASEDRETNCWGCGLRVSVAAYASVFKCGWCGAITKEHVVKNDSIRLRRWRDRCFVTVILNPFSPLRTLASYAITSTCSLANRILDFLSLYMLIFWHMVKTENCCYVFHSWTVYPVYNDIGDTGAGVWAVYPVIFAISYFHGVFHLAITVILSICTLSSFFLSAFQPAGVPPIIIWGSYPAVGQGGLQNYAFCHYCSKPKSPLVHHCRSCGTCVLGMDHHCPFIWPPVEHNRSLSRLSGFASPEFNFGVLKGNILAFFRSAVFISARGVVLVYLFIASFSVGTGLSVLLWQQLNFIYVGKTYLSHLISVDNEEICKYPTGAQELRVSLGNDVARNGKISCLVVLPVASSACLCEWSKARNYSQRPFLFYFCDKMPKRSLENGEVDLRRGVPV
ncbi:hypothetical protein SASPL_148828 [Salvia splendens]|uniref:S-acyltransferase n=1 Tax=Salvia splendens TaxID=180675 RepID=A0A8X8Z4N1_SALSN|nr:hypothetical protein SASPL_148828 [Salvia splendens]